MKYVNKTDICFLPPASERSMSQALPRQPAAAPVEAEAGLPYDLIETLFFAYRDFVGDPDRILTRYNFGRAHHRVLHFVNRNPGLTIAELLDILQITKQSLNRVLKELLEQGYVESRAGETDRRQRLLFPTAKGQELALALARPQAERIARATGRTSASDREAAFRYLAAMIDAVPQGGRGLA
jgi:DNA-binding MarR family transcriptional regulator